MSSVTADRAQLAPARHRARQDRVARRLIRRFGRRLGRRLLTVAMVTPWIILPLLPALGIGLSKWLGIGF